VDHLHVEGVAEDEGDAFGLAEVGEPVPGEHALGPDDESVAEGGDHVEEGSARSGQVTVEDRLALRVEDVGVQAPGMQIDAAVESVRLVVATHLVASVVAGRPDPASWLPVPQAPAETSTQRTGSNPAIPFYLATGSGPSPSRP
jgi:hypothetical protein